MRHIAFFGIVLLAPVAAIVVLVQFQSPRAPNLSVTFLGYTNDSSGSRLASFLVRNSEASAVQVLAPYICIQTPTNVVGHSEPGMMIVGAGLSKILVVRPPPRPSQWRINLRVTPDFGAWREIKCFVLYKLIRAGLHPRYQNMPYGIYGSWIKDDQ
jgi:hypothetical protein